MTALALFDAQGTWLDTHVCEGSIRMALRRHGPDFGRWEAQNAPRSRTDTACGAYTSELRCLPAPLRVAGIERLNPLAQRGRWRGLRRQLAAEHVLHRPEVLHFLDGFGVLYIRHPLGHLGLLCEAQDWVWLPAGTRCQLLLGDTPQLDVLRLLEQPLPWTGQPTDAPDPQLPSLDGYVEQLLGMVGQEVD